MPRPITEKSSKKYKTEYSKKYYLENKNKIQEKRAQNKEMSLEKMRNRGKVHREQFKDFLALFKNTSCLDCGNNFPAYVMDFDHVRGEKLFTISQGLSLGKSKKEIIAEIAKCDIVCANCHRVRTFLRRSPRKKRKSKAVEARILKYNELKSLPCTDCHISYPSESMDFDHVRGEKLFNVSTGIQKPDAIFFAEIAKCELVCANCHRERTNLRVDVNASL